MRNRAVLISLFIFSVSYALGIATKQIRPHIDSPLIQDAILGWFPSFIYVFGMLYIIPIYKHLLNQKETKTSAASKLNFRVNGS